MFKGLLVSFKHSLTFSLGDQYLQVFSFLMGSERFQEMAGSHPWHHPSVASPGLREKRLKGLLCAEGLETECLRKVPFNRDLTSKKNQTGTDLRAIMPSCGNSMYKGYQIGWTQCTGEQEGHTRYQHHAVRVRDSRNRDVT